MEEVYLKKYSNLVTPVINFTESLKRYSESIHEKVYMSWNAREVVKVLSGVTNEEYKNLNRKTNPQILNSTRNYRGEKMLPLKGFRQGYKLYDIVEDTPLKTLQYLKQNTNADKVSNRKSLRYPGEVHLGPKREDIEDLSQRNLKPFEDFVLTIRIYVPCSHKTKLQLPNSKSLVPKVGQEFLISNHNTLTDLRDKIACEEDFQDVSPDVSENPVEITAIRSGEIYKSAMFFIGDTFYVDVRNPENLNYSEVIREWAHWKKLNLKKVETMDSTIGTLEARMGYPYVYMHQGNCEHLIVITDARLLHPNDARILTYYPTLISFRAVRGKTCNLCSNEFAKYIVHGSDRLIYDWAFLCSNCTLMYNFNGLEKVNNFTLYKYTDRLGIL